MVLDTQILASLGINLGDEKSEALIQFFESTLQERIGLEVFDSLDDGHAIELLDIESRGDTKAIADYISKNIPSYKSIVEDETDILLGELADSADLIAA